MFQKKEKSKNAAFTEVYSEYYATVFGVLYLRTGNTDTAEELTQEVFIRYFNNVNDAVNPRGWLLTTAKFVSLEHYRKMNRNPDTVSIKDDDELFEKNVYSNGLDIRIIIDNAIESIKDHADRMIFDLVALQKYTFEEAGKLTGLSKRQIKYRHALVVREVIDALKKQGINSLEELL
jgi:RNA polymerase sigma-70 factor (ECF subfamily)